MSALILAVDDDPALLARYRDLCAAEGWACERWNVPRGPAAIFALAPDLIVVDLLFGQELLGFGFLTALKGRPLTANIPVVVCTAWPQAALHRDLFAAWAVPVLTKPFDADALVRTIRVVLGENDSADGARLPEAVDPPGNPAIG